MSSARVFAVVAGLALLSTTAFAVTQSAGQRQNDNRLPSGLTRNYLAGYDRGWGEGVAAGREDFDRNQGWDLEGQREMESADSGYQARFGPKGEYQDGYRDGFRAGYPDGWYRGMVARDPR